MDSFLKVFFLQLKKFCDTLEHIWFLFLEHIVAVNDIVKIFL